MSAEGCLSELGLSDDAVALVRMLVWAAFFGGFGGFLGLIRRIEYWQGPADRAMDGPPPRQNEDVWTYGGGRFTRSALVWIVAREVTLGAGGGIMLAGLLAAAGQVENITYAKRVILTGLFVAAGGISRRVMSIAQDRLESQISAAQESLASTKEDVAQTEAALKRQQAIVMAIAQIDQGAKVNIRQAAEELRAVVARDPRDRRAVILLGRAYRKLDRLSDAIRVLDSFVLQDGIKKEDKADALYNRACYQVLASNFEAALEDLEASIRLCPANADDAREDPDFAELNSAEGERFARLLDECTRSVDMVS